MRTRGLMALVATAAIAVAACSSSSGSAAPSLPTSVGNGEGALTVLAWPGYAENGSTDPSVQLGQAVRGFDRLQDHGPDVRHVR